MLFAQAAAGANRELLEGVTGLVAAVLLLYVSYWLHSRSSLGAWQRYLDERGGAALARNSVLSLAALAFLAVFREGAETVLFYIGIAPSIELGDLLLGIGAATVLLVVCGVLILGLGMRLPLRLFFMFSSVLIFYLAFKFVGTGIHALQVSGYLPASSQPQLPVQRSPGHVSDVGDDRRAGHPAAARRAGAAPPATSEYAPRWRRPSLALIIVSPVLAQTTPVPSDGRLGGDLSVQNRTSRAFGLPGPTLSPDELRKFVLGDGAFEASFVAGAAPANSGLGPLFLNASCGGCHVGDGRGLPVVGPGPRRSMSLVRVSVPGPAGHAPQPVPGIGTQLRDHATIGFVPEADVQLTWDEQAGRMRTARHTAFAHRGCRSRWRTGSR